MVIKEQEIPRKKDKRVLTLFFFAILSLLIAMCRSIDNPIVAIGFEAVLMFAQMIFLWNLLSDYYGDES